MRPPLARCWLLPAGTEYRSQEDAMGITPGGGQPGCENDHAWAMLAEDENL